MGISTQEAVAVTPLVTLGGPNCVSAVEAALWVRNGRRASVATISELRSLLGLLGAEPAWIEAKVHYVETGCWIYEGLA
jgi:hypothetical protein